MFNHKTRGIGAAIIIGLTSLAYCEDWPQWLGPKRDSVWRETGIIEQFPKKGPDIRWRLPIGAGYSGPAVAKGKVYVMDRELKAGAKKPSDPFAKGIVPGNERVLCIDEKTGVLLWKQEYDAPYSMSYSAGPRATPLVKDGKVYTLGAEGNLTCFDAEKGDILWSHDFNDDFKIATPLWGFSASPLIEGSRLICLAGGAGSVAVAYDKETGKELWRALSAKEPGYAPPTLIEAGGLKQLIIWHPEAVNSLNPETGEVYWSEKMASRMGLSVSTPRQWKDDLFLTAFYDGSRLLKLTGDKPGASVAWQSKKASERDTDMLHSIISSPFIEEGYIYGVCSYGQLRCLKVETGERVWETMAATTADQKETRWATAFLVKNGERFFLFNELGDLIIAKLTPAGYKEISRAHILEPTNTDPGRAVVWSHPAFANKAVFARNDKEIICVELGQKVENP